MVSKSHLKAEMLRLAAYQALPAPEVCSRLLIYDVQQLTCSSDSEVRPEEGSSGLGRRAHRRWTHRPQTGDFQCDTPLGWGRTGGRWCGRPGRAPGRRAAAGSARGAAPPAPPTATACARAPAAAGCSAQAHTLRHAGGISCAHRAVQRAAP